MGSDNQKFQICNGPAKWDLVLALFDGSVADKTVRRVRFVVEFTFRQRVAIDIYAALPDIKLA